MHHITFEQVYTSASVDAAFAWRFNFCAKRLYPPLSCSLMHAHTYTAHDIVLSPASCILWHINNRECFLQTAQIACNWIYYIHKHYMCERDSSYYASITKAQWTDSMTFIFITFRFLRLCIVYVQYLRLPEFLFRNYASDVQTF